MKHSFHLTKNGTIERCMAFLRACPCSVHFETREEGESYLQEWETRKIRYGDIRFEPILEPKIGWVCPLNEFENTNRFSGLHVTEDSFAIVEDESFSKESFHNYMKFLITSGKMSRENVARGIGHLGLKGLLVGDQITRHSEQANKNYIDIPEKAEEMYVSEALFCYDKLVLEKKESLVSIARAFQFEISDQLLENGTKLRVFSRPAPLVYQVGDEIIP